MRTIIERNDLIAVGALMFEDYIAVVLEEMDIVPGYLADGA